MTDSRLEREDIKDLNPPNQNSPILFFGNDWGAENRTSSHHIARWLARNHRVYYIECPGLRAPQRTGRDLKKIWKKIVQFARGARPVEKNIQVWTLLQIPFHRFSIVRRLNIVLALLSLRWVMWCESIRQPITWSMLPHPCSVVKRLNEVVAVYYCTDDYASMPGVNAAAIRLMDEEMTRKSDVVFVSSETLLESKLRLNPETHVSPHGVDVDHFARAQDESLPVPAEMTGMPHPIVGFFGLIERWIDLDLIGFLAEQRPNRTFVLIGRLACPADHLINRSNVHFLGKRAYEDLPVYGKQFDAAIIPYRLVPQVYHANPLKLREYLAMGKPIVSVRTPEIEKYADVVEIVDSHEEFLKKLDTLLSQPDSPTEISRRMRRVSSMSWDARLTELYKIVETRLYSPTNRTDLIGRIPLR